VTGITVCSFSTHAGTGLQPGFASGRRAQARGLKRAVRGSVIVWTARARNSLRLRARGGGGKISLSARAPLTFFVPALAVVFDGRGDAWPPTGRGPDGKLILFPKKERG